MNEIFIVQWFNDHANGEEFKDMGAYVFTDLSVAKQQLISIIASNCKRYNGKKLVMNIDDIPNEGLIECYELHPYIYKIIKINVHSVF